MAGTAPVPIDYIRGHKMQARALRVYVSVYAQNLEHLITATIYFHLSTRLAFRARALLRPLRQKYAQRMWFFYFLYFVESVCVCVCVGLSASA